MRPRVLREAEDELREAMLYYEDRQQGLAADFHARVGEAVRSIGEDPLRFPVYEGKRLRHEFRRALVGRFPYVVVFEIRQDELLVVAIAHTSRDPGYWLRR